MIRRLAYADWNHAPIQPHGKILQMIFDEGDASVRGQEKDEDVSILLSNAPTDAREPSDRQSQAHSNRIGMSHAGTASHPDDEFVVLTQRHDRFNQRQHRFRPPVHYALTANRNKTHIG